MHFCLLFRMAVSRGNKPSKDRYYFSPICFCFLFGSFNNDGFLTFIPAWSSPSPLSSPTPLPPPSDEGALPGWGWLHSISSPLRVLRVMPQTCLSSHYAWTDVDWMWEELLMGGRQERDWGEHLTPSGKALSRWTGSSRRHKAKFKHRHSAKNGTPAHATSCISIAALPSLSSLFTTHLTPLPPSKTTTFSIILFNITPPAFG